jgi:hypothetical protein
MPEYFLKVKEKKRTGFFNWEKGSMDFRFL